MKLFIKQIYFILLIACCSLLTINYAKSELPVNQAEFLSPDEAFKIDYNIVDKNHVKINWIIHPGYYLYMGMFEFKSLNANKILKVEMPEGKKKQDEFFGDVDVYYYSAEADVYFVDDIEDSIELKVKYQGCADAGLCYPPVFKTITLKKNTSLNNLKRTSLFESQNAMSDSLLSNSIVYNSIIFFLAGLLLAFTPCVLPMVPILTGIIAGQGNVSQKKSITLSIIYVLSMSLTYAVAGIIVAVSGTNIQASLQNPYVIGAISLLFFIFALAMFKFFDIQMPKSIQTVMTQLSNKQKSGSYGDVAVMGVLSALIVGPCVTAPLIGALIYIASTGDVLVGGIALFSLGIGMGAPLILLGSTTTKLISKIGPYLQLVNYFFGALFLVVSIWLLERILSIEVAAYLWALASLILIFIFIKSLNIINNLISTSIIFISSFFLVIYFSLQINGIQKNSYYDPITSFIEKEKFVQFITVKTTQDLEKEIRNSNKPVMIDLYADWCVACKELEKYTFSDPKVSKILNQFKLIKFDITNTNEEHSKYLQSMRIFGPPALFFYDTSGKEINEARVVGFMDSSDFLKVLKIVKN
ncbi:protein-disulfide reductase DsbD [Gammaproteobacteria bacterium]|nr:protein-disulfide reductase DsbD [Gammaproteobacteria bacterium]